MGGPNEKSSELNRGSSLRASVRLSNVEGDDDDYDLQAMGIADGFRPVVPHLSRDPIATLRDAPTTQVPPARPSSITKPHRRDESLSLQHDGPTTESDTDITRNRTSDVSQASPFVDPEEPYEGPSGPSHPYQMYPQNVRVVSVATTSTAPISEPSYNGPRGPAHPYGMYPQNTVPETDGMPNRTAQAEIGVGFPGATDNYQRRIGPDGEDVADLIGPDGHTEQLPPYTRYPEETYNRKVMGLETPQPAPTQPLQPLQPLPTQPAQPILAIPGAGGIGMATRNPEFGSTDDLNSINSPQSRQSVRSFTSDGSSRTLNDASRSTTNEMNEKKPLKDWQTTAKRRVWGIVPCWAIILSGIVLVVMGVVLGAVIGTVLNSHGKKPPPPNRPASPAVSPSWDTQPLTTLPSNLPPLQTGTFAMPLMNNRISNTCFSDSTLAQAWNCNLVFSQLSMTITKLADQPNISDYSFGFSYNETYSLENYVYSYGVQPPNLTDVKLKLVSDVYEASRGPAWNFEVTYNKTVVLPEQLLAPSSSTSSTQNSRRMLFGGGDFKRKGVAQPGEKPWICHWDDTILEAFIYAGQNNSFSRPIDPRPPMPMTSAPTPSESFSGAPASAPTAENTDLPSGIDNSGGFKPSPGDFGNPEDHHTSPPVTDGVPMSTTTSSPSPSSSDWFGKDPFMPDNPMPVYPRVVKVEERRSSISSTAKPFCRQYRIVGEYQEAVPVLDANGNMIEVQIDEEERSYDGSGQSRRSAIEHYLGTRGGAKSGSDMSDCGCMWWLT
ncbi:hypothetical protein Hte_002191 [Hypoxylon texense]